MLAYVPMEILIVPTVDNNLTAQCLIHMYIYLYLHIPISTYTYIDIHLYLHIPILTYSFRQKEYQVAWHYQ